MNLNAGFAFEICFVVLVLCSSAIAQCNNPDAGDCCEKKGNETPGCNDSECCHFVCEIDAYCCEDEWDRSCATQAENLCGILCGGGIPTCYGAMGDCCEDNGSPGCNDLECCNSICEIDPFCCNNTWDGICADEAELLCSNGLVCFGVLKACLGATGDCCSDNGKEGAGCKDGECCVTVCQLDPYCCEFQWDGICADEAMDLCAICKIPLCPWDLDNDGSVGTSDLLELLAQWGTDGSADFDESGAVGTDDLLILLANWGPCG